MQTKSEGYPCPRCVVGRCLPQRTTFAEIYHGQLLSIPNRLAFICDVCQFVEFESTGLESLWQELYGDSATDDFQSARHPGRSSSYGG